MKTGIIHLSDLHVADRYDIETKKLISGSYFTDFVDNFTNQFIKRVNTLIAENQIEELILVISGDLSNTSEYSEYQITIEFVNVIKTELNIKNVLIVPGNHDVNWLKIKVTSNDLKKKSIEEWKTKPNHKYIEKYDEFKEFYKSLTSDDFNETVNIFKKIFISSDKIILLGINSTFLNSDYDRNEKVRGSFISKEKIKEELKIIKESHPDKLLIAIFHHNPITSIDSNKFGIDDWVSYEKIFNDFGLRTFMYGHEHTANSFILKNSNFLASGSFGKKDATSTNKFNFIIVDDSENSVNLNIRINNFIADPGSEHLDIGYWEAADFNYTKEFILWEKPSKIETKSEDLIPKDVQDTRVINKIDDINPNIVTTKSNQKDLIAIIKTDKLFKSGHFHWSDTSKAHNWIDTNTLLSNRNNLMIIKNLFLEKISSIQTNFDLVIGVGIEGNIIASSIAHVLNLQYLYIPYSFRDNDHNKYEKETFGIKSINPLIITDVVHDGRTNLKLIQQQSEIFSNSKKITLISLFYTGKNGKTLCFNEEQRIDYQYISNDFQVNSCDYGCDFRKECIIYEKQIEDVYEFYDSKLNE